MILKPKALRNRKYSWQRQPKDDRDYKSVVHKKVAVALPPAFQFSDKSPVYDQLNEGSCVANSAAANYRYRLFDMLRSWNFDPSRQFLYYTVRELEGTTGCDCGAYCRDAFKALNKWGICKEELWAYSQPYSRRPTAQAYTDGMNQLVLEYAAVAQDLTTLKQTIYAGHPITFGFDVYSSFESSNWWKTTGVMPIPKSGERFLGGHSVLIIGWDDAKQCFLCQNSWGNGWGLNGYFWFPYSYMVSNHADDFWVIQDIYFKDAPKPDPTPDPVDPSDNTGCLLPFLKKVFTTKTELGVLREASVVAMGKEIGLPTDIKLLKSENLKLVEKAIGL